MHPQHHAPTGNRRQAIWSGTGWLLLPVAAQARPDAPLVEVSKSPTCGCCNDGVAHLEANGFCTVVYDTGNATVRSRLGVAMQYGSCHTARVAGYGVEGHVPAANIWRRLKERPKAVGLPVPGMPLGSPGMDGAEYNGHKDPDDVLRIAANGSPSVYQPHR